MADKEIKNILFAASGLEDQILDVTQDYAPDLIKDSPDLIKSCAAKIESLRNQYREKHRELRFHLQDQEDVYEQTYNKQLTLITTKVSEYVRCLTKYDIANSTTSQSIQNHKSRFAIDDLAQSMKHLKTTITFIAGKCTNEDLKHRKKDLSSVNTEFNNLSQKMRELLDLNVQPDQFDNLKKDYDQLLELRLSYESSLQDEYKIRELDKFDNFKKSQLNIKLPTFTGYDSHIDIYTFKSEFNKLFSDIPKSYQSDLLKNNHLGKHALELVKNVTDIQDI